MKEMKIDLDLLYEQIKACEIKVDNASDGDEYDLFLGIENLLVAIAEATENGEIVQFTNTTDGSED